MTSLRWRSAPSAFSPLDTQTLYAGTGSFSSFGFDGGVGAGIYKSTDGGDTWTVLAHETFAFRYMKSVVPTGLTTGDGEVVLVGTFFDGGGVYRSEDGGVTFDRLSGSPGTGLPDAGVSHLVADPSDPDRYYAGIPGRGVLPERGRRPDLGGDQRRHPRRDSGQLPRRARRPRRHGRRHPRRLRRPAEGWPADQLLPLRRSGRRLGPDGPAPGPMRTARMSA